MAVKIRLKRLGKKKQPFYRIVVADSRAPRDGRSIEKLGYYNPITEPAEFVVDEERLFHWMDEGAQPSDTVFSLLRGRGITLRYELKSRNADEATISKEMHKWELSQDQKSKKKAAAAEAKMAAAEVEKPAPETAEETSAETAAEEVAEEEVETPAEIAEEEKPAAEAVEEVQDAPAEEVNEDASEDVAEAPEKVPAAEPTEEPAEAPAESLEKEDS